MDAHGMPMQVRVIAFATASDIVGRLPLTFSLPDNSRLTDLRHLLAERFPAIDTLWPRLAIAIDGELSQMDRQLSDGCEVALLPPVSGGSGDPPVLVDEPIDVAALESRVRNRSCGAVVLFLGTVRDHHQGREVTALTYSAYRPMAETRLRAITTELEVGDEGLHVAIVHRLGEVPVGEPSVAIAVSSPHRAAAYDASREALERLKREVPIWKRERYADGETIWREEEPLSGPATPTPARPTAVLTE